MKTFGLIFILLILSNCTNDNKKKLSKPENKNDTIVIKKNLNVEIDNTYPTQTIKEIEYFVSVKDKSSNLKYNFSERNDGKIAISRNYDLPNLPSQKNILEFDELKYVLKEAKNDFKIDSLKYLIYGTLDTAENINSIKEITQKYLEYRNNKSNINTKDYGKISDIILHSNIVSEINKNLSKYSKSVTKISIEKAHFHKSDRDISETLNCFVVMTIE